MESTTVTQPVKKTIKLVNRRHQAILNHYSFDEVLSIMGFYDGSNEDLQSESVKNDYANNKEQFKESVMRLAAVSNHFSHLMPRDIPKPLPTVPTTKEDINAEADKIVEKARKDSERYVAEMRNTYTGEMLTSSSTHRF